jgi:hypothetical protein
MRKHFINAAKVTALAAHFYLLQFLLQLLLPSSDMTMAFWPMVIMAGAQLLGGAANRNAAKKANRKNRKQSEAERRLQYQMWNEGHALFGPASVTDPGLNYFQLSKQSDERLLELAAKYGISSRQIEEKYKVKKKRWYDPAGLFGSSTKTRSVLDREALIAELQQKSGRPDKEMFAHQLDQYRDAMPYSEVSSYADIPTMYEGLQRGADDTAKGIFDESLTDRRISFYQPVFDARQGLVDSRKQAEETALQDTLGNLEARQRQKGYSGDSLAGLQLEGRARKASAGTISKMQMLANLQNQTDVLNQRMKGQELKINNMGLANTQASRAAQMRMIPVTAATDAALQSQKAMQFYRMKQGAPQLPGLPQYQQLPTNTELFAKTAGTIAGGIMQQNAQDSYMSNLKDIAKIQYGGGGQGGTGGYLPMPTGNAFSRKPIYGGGGGP